MSNTPRIQTITIKGERFVLLPEAEYDRLRNEPAEPVLPPRDEQGNYPALEAMRAVMGRDIIRERRRLGLTQIELARRAGIRPETLNRIEKGVRAPSVSTADQIEAAFEQAKAESLAE